MDLQRCLVFLYLLSSIIITLSAAAQPADLVFSVCSKTGNYTPNSTYHTNLNTLLSSLSSEVNEYGFYNASEGQSPDMTSVVALCRGDVKLDTCRVCVTDAAKKLAQLCPNQKEAFGGYDECVILYSHRFIIGSISKDPYVYRWNSENATSIDQFNEDLRKLLADLGSQAAKGSSFLKFAAGKTTGPDFQPIYALVQCTPDLSAQDCSACLNASFGEISNSKCDKCYGKRGAGIIWPSCNFRYGSERFFSDTLIQVPATPPLPLSPPTTSPPPQSQSGGKDSKEDDQHTTPTALFVVVPVIVVVVMVTIIVCIVLRKRRKRRQENGGMEEKESQKLCIDQSEVAEEPSSSVEICAVESLVKFNLITLQNATDNFSKTKKIGEGGFGTVYKGTLENDQLVAVKRLSEHSRQGNLEFKNEVDFIAKLQHNNLVKLHGYCQEGREMILVYEFVSNGGLDGFLFDRDKCGYLDWERRYIIIESIASGLIYLHKESSPNRIIHRDLKASNILLDANLNPKITDFGMARLFALNQTQGSTNTLVGSHGYIAPEYARFGIYSDKSDVYSFGVLVLEIISGQRNTIQSGNSKKDLLSDVWIEWEKGSTSNVIDPLLKRPSSPKQEIERCIHVALLCVQENADDRPKMPIVHDMLNRNLSMKLPKPSVPGFYTQSRVNS
ncbi:PREDICTED: cysteine-rich receptor-like protein kinase 10 [Ipomoea nil]|uniref:cysteine-rich receptor-like protein kinase 10 n=1 Tax=Ipomoea nil TaxID=35883 RepID=UPI00090119DB|nr:PREDICTED: cysteine-rich receptor-like protein kinase 10 [Ipomoea nil]